MADYRYEDWTFRKSNIEQKSTHHVLFQETSNGNDREPFKEQEQTS